MLAQTDKRSDERVASNAPIIFSLFSTRFWKEYSSMTRNHSKRGMCFKSGHPLTPGAHLFIRVDNDPDSNSRVRLRNSTLAVVKWCRKLTDEHATGYASANSSERKMRIYSNRMRTAILETIGWEIAPKLCGLQERIASLLTEELQE